MIRVGVDDLKGKTEAQRAAYVRRRLETAAQQGDDWSPRSRLPTIAPLAQLLPDGLACGAVVDYRGAVSPLLGMLAVASAAGLDTALVNLPARQGLAAGLLAAQEMGGVLTRMYAVASPEQELATVVNTLLDGLALVIVGVGDAALAPGVAKILAKRAHDRECTLVLADARRQFPSADLRLVIECAGYEGLSRGRGLLRGQRYSVTATPRGGRSVYGEIRMAACGGGNVEWGRVESAAAVIEFPAMATG
ncbi:hypothetical protein ACQP1G_20950 [Nocardia sp. CA-107356]|uniref:hypothetical protein n=1 Tax=Nocardia sp. CA-107356 TaxID=3239972 RepID=UPI003D8A61EA